jgi:predicted nuclease of predicted toxin-antitoxin system
LRRLSLIARKKKQRDEESPVFALDENLGTTILPRYLQRADLRVVTFEALGLRGEQDPWAFYYCGKNDYCLVTSDKSFLDHFTHMAAIQLGKTRVFAFTSGNENMNLRGKAFVNAKARILRVIRHHAPPFVASIGLSDDVNVVDEKPMPTKKLCRPEHWESYLKVCRAEGVEVHEKAYTVAGSDYLSRRGKGATKGEAATEADEPKANGGSGES